MHTCANASDSKAGTILLIAQARCFSETCPGSRVVAHLVFWQQTVLLHEMDTTDNTCLALPRTLSNGIGFYVSCVPSKAVHVTLLCLHSAVVVIDQPRAVKYSSAAATPYTAMCTNWVALPVRTGASVQCSAHTLPGSHRTIQAV